MNIRWIAEIGSNHNQNLDRCYDIIDSAQEIGCWAVKFQLFKADKLYAPEFKDKIEQMKTWELPDTFIASIAQYCQNVGIKFICTPFDLEAVKLLKPYVDYFKIGSYELLNHNLIKAVAKTKKPWILSVGMATLDEVDKSINQMIQLPEIILCCNSSYPAKPKNCYLERIGFAYGWMFSSSIGWSDHTVEPGVIYKAIACGAEVIEFHMDLEGNGFEYRIGHCWLPYQIKEVIRNVKIGEEACLPIDNKDDENRKWRMDPEDGMRPLKKYRKELLKYELE